ncbi:nucleolar protein 12-domain-containing protein [Coniochaeta sp. 2T2.1]|nr:nucleolar protein 12-domain-containing protein [Coniochaeta sp. 2T2.1]
MFAKPRVKKGIPTPPLKKRKRGHALEEINYDPDARTEYLTGFRKRKLQRIKVAKEAAAEQERQDKIKARKQMRDERKQAVEDHVETVNRLLKEARKAGTSDTESEGEEDDDAFGGFADEPIQPVDLEEEYIDEDKYTTVTIEAVNVDKDGMHKPDAEDGDEEDDDEEEDGEGKKADKAKEDAAPEKSKKEWPKKPKKKKFRYETKIERKLTEAKRKVKAAKASA